MQYNVLVVEDDRTVASYIRYILQYSGLNPIVVCSAEEADKHAADADLIVLDINLPKLSGDKFLEQVRNKGNYAPTIIVSGAELTQDVIDRLARCGIVDFLRKPFTADQLQAQVSRAIGILKDMASLGDASTRIRNFVEKRTAM